MTTLPLILIALAAPGPAPVTRPAEPLSAPSIEGGDEVDQLIDNARQLLDAGRPEEALAVFELAAATEPGTRTQAWVVRAWLGLGRVQDGLLATDELKAAGADPVMIDYLYGMGFYLSAKGDVDAGTTGAVTGEQFGDAARMFQRATSADESRFPDAWYPLAEAAWYTQDLPLARAAVEIALATQPAETGTLFLRGRIAMSQFAEAQADEARAEEAGRYWATAVESFEAAADRLAESEDPTDHWWSASAAFQAGNAYMWKEDKRAEAKNAYARAMSLAPDAVEFGQVWTTLGGQDMLAVLEDAHARYLARYSAEGPGDAALLWWKGYTQLDQARFELAEESLLAALDKNPSYVNSWFYVYRSRYARQDYVGALHALRSYHALDAEGTATAIGNDWERQFRDLGFLVGWCVEPGQGGPGNLEAAFLSEILCEVAPTESTFWNNLGLFLRDEGERMKRRRDPNDDPEVMRDLFERSYVAYRRALELDPTNPNYLNDTAVLLHYHLDRDLDKAREWYEESYRQAVARLEREDLGEEERGVIEIARRDSKNNIVLLDELIAQKKREANPHEAPEANGGGSGSR